MEVGTGSPRRGIVPISNINLSSFLNIFVTIYGYAFFNATCLPLIPSLERIKACLHVAVSAKAGVGLLRCSFPTISFQYILPDNYLFRQQKSIVFQHPDNVNARIQAGVNCLLFCAVKPGTVNLLSQHIIHSHPAG